MLSGFSDDPIALPLGRCGVVVPMTEEEVRSLVLDMWSRGEVEVDFVGETMEVSTLQVEEYDGRLRYSYDVDLRMTSLMTRIRAEVEEMGGPCEMSYEIEIEDDVLMVYLLINFASPQWLEPTINKSIYEDDEKLEYLHFLALREMLSPSSFLLFHTLDKLVVGTFTLSREQQVNILRSRDFTLRFASWNAFLSVKAEDILLMTDSPSPQYHDDILRFLYRYLEGQHERMSALPLTSPQGEEEVIGQPTPTPKMTEGELDMSLNP
jgi:hypothetical protein